MSLREIISCNSNCMVLEEQGNCKCNAIHLKTPRKLSCNPLNTIGTVLITALIPRNINAVTNFITAMQLIPVNCNTVTGTAIKLIRPISATITVLYHSPKTVAVIQLKLLRSAVYARDLVLSAPKTAVFPGIWSSLHPTPSTDAREEGGARRKQRTRQNIHNCNGPVEVS